MELKQRSNFRMAFVLRIMPFIGYNIRILLVFSETHFCETPISCGLNKKNQTILHPCVAFWDLLPCFYHVNRSKVKALEERACFKLHYMPAQLHRLDGIPPPHNKKCLNEWSTNDRRSNKYGVMSFVDYFQMIPLILTAFIFELPVPGDFLNWLPPRCCFYRIVQDYTPENVWLLTPWPKEARATLESSYLCFSNIFGPFLRGDGSLFLIFFRTLVKLQNVDKFCFLVHMYFQTLLVQLHFLWAGNRPRG